MTGITVDSGGSGCRTKPAVVLSGGGGNGATAKAVLSDDQVSLVIVLTAGDGSTSAPTVAIEAPPKALNVMLKLVPKLAVSSPVECSEGAPGYAGLAAIVLLGLAKRRSNRTGKTG